jgi:glycosyltransferase involved in cell wall biosynthesis
MIIVVAPYSPVSLSNQPHLGAARKIEMVIESLYELDPDILLVNSAHNEVGTEEKVEDIKIGSIIVKHFTLPCYSNQKVGKLLNLKDVNRTINKCLELGKPSLVWIYNSYAFENLFSNRINKKIKVPVVFEFEDWHFSRSRGFNPKPYIDDFLWKSNLKNINFAFGVNDNLTNKMRDLGITSQLLPGIVPEKLIELCDKKKCFNLDTIKVGYFGGLSDEKGVDKIIDVIDKLPDGFKVVMSGAGTLESNLKELSIKYADKLEFHGKVSDKKLYDLIASVDVILNPHSPITDMSEGVFPFKVIEGIASGRLLISTDVPAANLDGLTDGVLFYDGSSHKLLECIINSENFYIDNSSTVNASKNIAREAFSKASLLKPISKLLNEL